MRLPWQVSGVIITDHLNKQQLSKMRMVFALNNTWAGDLVFLRVQKSAFMRQVLSPTTLKK